MLTPSVNTVDINIKALPSSWLVIVHAPGCCLVLYILRSSEDLRGAELPEALRCFGKLMARISC